MKMARWEQLKNNRIVETESGQYAIVLEYRENAMSIRDYKKRKAATRTQENAEEIERKQRYHTIWKTKGHGWLGDN